MLNEHDVVNGLLEFEGILLSRADVAERAVEAHDGGKAAEAADEASAAPEAIGGRVEAVAAPGSGVQVQVVVTQGVGRRRR